MPMGSLATICARTEEDAETFTSLARLNSGFIGSIYSAESSSSGIGSMDDVERGTSTRKHTQRRIILVTRRLSSITLLRYSQGMWKTKTPLHPTASSSAASTRPAS